jgi:hypothetical protein
MNPIVSRELGRVSALQRCDGSRNGALVATAAVFRK